MKREFIRQSISRILFISIFLSPVLYYSEHYQVTMKQQPVLYSPETNLSIIMKKKAFTDINPYVLECRIPPSSELVNLPTTPSAYRIKNVLYQGYPAPSEFSDVTLLSWNPTSLIKHRASTCAYQNGYDYNTHFYPAFSETIESAISNRYDDSLISQTPVFEWIDGEALTVFMTQLGEIIAWQPSLSRTKWIKQLPVNENPVSTLATYQMKSKVYLLFSTDRKTLYQVDMETGGEERRITLEENIQSPMQILESEGQLLLTFKTDKAIYGWDLFDWKMLFKREEPSFSDLSPFIAQIGHQKAIIQPFPAGRILCLNFLGETLWDLDTQGKIRQDVSMQVRNGILWLTAVTDEPSLLLIQAGQGKVEKKKKLGGYACSPIVFIPNALSCSLVLSTDKGESGFFSTDFDDTNRKDTWIPIPLRNCLSFFAMQQSQEPDFLILNEKLEWMVVQTGLRKLPYPFPKALSEKQQTALATLSRNPSAVIEGAVLINMGSSGFVMIGNPSLPDMWKANHWKHKGLAFNKSTAEIPYTNQTYRTDLDTFPDFTKKRNAKVMIPDISLDQPLLNPVLWLDSISGKQYALIPSYPDSLFILDEQMNIHFSLPLSHGIVVTEPILEQQKNGDYILWVLTNKVLLEVWIRHDFVKYSIQVLATDLCSAGGSFLKSSKHNGLDLIFVDDQNFLVVFSIPQKQIRYKEPVDAKNIAIHYWDGEKYLFCGSKVIRFQNGEVISRKGIKGSNSTVIAFQGRLQWIQSTEDDIICMDALKGEIIWTVRRLWCKSFCLFQSNVSVQNHLNDGQVIVSDYTRILSIDLIRGYIQWSYNLFSATADTFIHQPSIIEFPDSNYVFAGSFKGKLYVLNASTGESLKGFPILLPEPAESKEINKGASMPIVLNGNLWVYRKGFGFIQFGQPVPSSRNFPVVQFQVHEKKREKKNNFSWFRSVLYWNGSFTFSNRLKIPW